MEFRRLRYFLGVAETLSFTKAAAELNIVQPALSRQVQQLEEELGVLLFERDKRNVRLTAAGTYMQEAAKRLIGEMEHMREQALYIQNGLRGSLKIGYPGSALYSIVPGSLAKLRQMFPDVESLLTEIANDEPFDLLLRYKIDVVFTRERNREPKLQEKSLFSEPLALVVPDDHPLTRDNFQSIAQCRDEPFIMQPDLLKLATFGHQLRHIFATAGFSPRIAYESSYGSTILRLVEKKLGVTVVPFSYCFGTSLRVRFIPLPDTTHLYVVWRTNDSNPILKNYLSICDEVVNDLHFS
jgi:LysR family transcriptional regulator, benzoate and cis,cis-muconate-responsive activator of ben and cat genes